MVFEKLSQLIAEHFSIDVEDITMDTNFMEDLNADSLDVVDIAMSLEDEFGIEFPDEDLEKVRTVGDVVKYLEEVVE